MPRAPWALLRAAPITLHGLVVLPLLLWWAADGAGFPVGQWAPGLLLVLGLLALALVLVPNAWGDVPRTVLLATGLLSAFTLWSYATILWADDPGAALEGANRTLLYLVLFALFALWRQRARTAAVLVVGWTIGIISIAFVTAVRLPTDSNPLTLFDDGRLATPVGYPNAAAATFAMAVWPAVVLAGAARIPAALRGLCAGGAVLLVDLALLTESRGAALALPITGLVVLALVPGRLRSLAVLAAVAAGVAATAPAMLDVADAIAASGGDPAATVAVAGRRMLLAAALVGLLVGGVAAFERARPPQPATRRRIAGAGRVLVGLAVAAALVGGLAAGPVDRLDSAWTSFKGGYEDNDENAGTRLVGGLGSNRYDFYRVAWDQFTAAPLIGQGGDNFQQAYLVEGNSTETPRYPHSVELRTLGQTGLVGSLLLLGGLLAAAWAALLGFRRSPGANAGLRAAVGGAALAGATYPFVHGSADWFWETAGLSGPAFALLGLAAALAPRPDPPGALVTSARTPFEVAGVVLVTLGLAVVVAGPLLSAQEVTKASRVFARDPLEAYARLERAASLNPLADRPEVLEGSIALRFGDLPRADAAFARALERVPDGQYATLQRGAIASARGDRAGAERLLARAVRLAPRDLLAREALDVVREGGTIDLANLSRRILEAAEQFGR